MKNYYKIPVWLLGLSTAIIFFGTIEQALFGNYFYSFVGVLALFGLIYYTFINVKE